MKTNSQAKYSSQVTKGSIGRTSSENFLYSAVKGYTEITNAAVSKDQAVEKGA